MMKLLILIPLAWMILSDYRSRTVVLWQLLLFGILVLTTCVVEYGLQLTFMNITINSMLSLFIGVCTSLYFLIKYKSIQSIIGIGDILFILFLTPLFTPRAFLLFMLISFITTLCMWGIYSLVQKHSANIPLISGVGLCLSVLLIYQQINTIT